MGDAVVLKRGGSPGSGVIHVWKEYNLNTSVKYVWDKWSLVTTLKYKWDKYSVLNNPSYPVYTTPSSTPRKPVGKSSYVYDGTRFALTGNDVNGIGSYADTGNSGIMQYCSSYDSSEYKLVLYYAPNATSNSPNATLESNMYGVKGEYINQVVSTNSSAYPSNGISGSYWYVSAGSDTSYSKGSTSYGQVESTSSTTYPNPGNHTDGYWYENRQEVPVYSMGTFKQNVYSTNPNMYPQNGRLGDYWYVYDGTIS